MLLFEESFSHMQHEPVNDMMPGLATSKPMTDPAYAENPEIQIT